MATYLYTSEKMHLCRCPRCGELHKKKVFWTGRDTIPLFLCQKCKDENIEYDPNRIVDACELE